MNEENKGRRDREIEDEIVIALAAGSRDLSLPLRIRGLCFMAQAVIDRLTLVEDIQLSKPPAAEEEPPVSRPGEIAPPAAKHRHKYNAEGKCMETLTEGARAGLLCFELSRAAKKAAGWGAGAPPAPAGGSS